MKTLLHILFLSFATNGMAQLASDHDEWSPKVPIMLKSEVSERSEFEMFEIDFDWMLDVQTEVINGIWYSPTIEFNLNTPRGFNLQLQTGGHCLP